MERQAISTDEARGMAVDDLYRALSSQREGLTRSEAEDRIKRFGPNELPEKEESAVLKFLRYFWGPIPWMIEAALIISAAIGRWEDFAIIFALLLVNAVVGFWQEYQAGNAIAMLKRRLALEARVLRDGRWRRPPHGTSFPATSSGSGTGTSCPADIKPRRGDFLSADESALTGESMPVENTHQTSPTLAPPSNRAR